MNAPAIYCSAEVEHGDHIIVLKDSQTDIPALSEFLSCAQTGDAAAALRRERDTAAVEESLQTLRATGKLAVEPELWDPLVLGGGAADFDPVVYLDNFRAKLAALESKGVNCLFYCSLMRWLDELIDPKLDDLVFIEASICADMAKSRRAVACVYDVARVSGSMLAQLLRIHPKICMGDRLVLNPLYESPEQVLARLRGR